MCFTNFIERHTVHQSFPGLGPILGYKQTETQYEKTENVGGEGIRVNNVNYEEVN